MKNCCSLKLFIFSKLVAAHIFLIYFLALHRAATPKMGIKEIKHALTDGLTR